MSDFMDVEGRGAGQTGTIELEFHDALGIFEQKLRAMERRGGGDGSERQDHEKRLLRALEDVCTSRSRTYHMTDATRETTLYAEAVTWKLLCMRRMEMDWAEHKVVAAKELVERSAHEVLLELENDREFRRLDCIVMWLEMQQQEMLGYFQDEINEGIVAMWPATRGWVEDGDQRWPRGRSLDPDAPYGKELSRDGRPMKLHEVDEADDCKLLERVWRYIRAGMVDAASDLCRRCGQPWRAASISGGEAWSVVADSEGRFNRFNSVRSWQWLQMCHKMARALKEVEDKQKRSAPRHRDSVVHWEWTLYAALARCPELLTESDKCKTWEDQCWAYFHAKRECYLLSKIKAVQEEKRLCSTLYPDLMPQDVASAAPITTADKLSIEEVFKKIEHLAGSLGPERRVQASIIKQELRQVLVELMDAATVRNLSHASFDRKSQLLRLLVHLAIYAKVALGPRQFNESLPAPLRSKVHGLVEAYMDHLMSDASHVHFTALYASYLPLPARHDKFSHCMRAVSKTQDRRQCLEECTTYLAPVLDIIINDILEYSRTTPIVTSARQTPELKREAEGFCQWLVERDQGIEALCRRLPPAELLWIKALEWCYLPHLHAVSDLTIVHVNAFLRELIIRSAQSSDSGSGGGALISDAFRLVASYSSHLLDMSRREAATLHSHTQEWMYWQAYTRAQEAFLAWSRGLAELNASLDELEQLGRQGARAIASDLPASLSVSDLLQPIAERVEAVWRAMGTASTELLGNLNPSHGVWMDVEPSGLEAGEGVGDELVLQHVFHGSRVERRATELRRLQATCIPEMVAMLDKVYFETGRSIERAFVRRTEATQPGEAGDSTLDSFRETAEECYMLSLKVAEVVATPRWSIFQFFPKGVGQTDGSYMPEPFTLDDFMKRMERSSLALLGLNKSTNWAAIMARLSARYPGR